MSRPRRYLNAPAHCRAESLDQADFILYSREDCLRCELAEPLLREFCQRQNKRYAVVMIDQAPLGLRQRYHTQVPVLTYHGRELCCHELDPAVLDQTIE